VKLTVHCFAYIHVITYIVRYMRIPVLLHVDIPLQTTPREAAACASRSWRSERVPDAPNAGPRGHAQAKNAHSQTGQKRPIQLQLYRLVHCGVLYVVIFLLSAFRLIEDFVFHSLGPVLAHLSGTHAF